jgi:hypothetical protein
VQTDGKWGVIRANGTFVAECIYDEITEGKGLCYKLKSGSSEKIILPSSTEINEDEVKAIGPLIYDHYEYSSPEGKVYFSIINGQQASEYEPPIPAYQQMLKSRKIKQ